jgi:hypothetical protein
VDLDCDGHKDILSGSYSRNSQPMAGLFQVLWGKPDGTFRKAEVLNGTDDEPLLIPLGPGKDAWIDGICTRPTAVDWNGDGKLDLVTGNFTGTFYLFMGEGKGRFAPKGTLIESGGEPLQIEGHHSDPFFIDWDGDGDLDLLSGSSNGGVQWAQNSAGAGKPLQLKRFETLIKPPTDIQPVAFLREAELKGPTASARIWVDDINSDGKLDILVGDAVTLVSPAKGLSEADSQAKAAEWQKEWEEALKELNSSPDAESKEPGDQKQKADAQKRIQELYSQRAKFVNEEATGFVWLYTQK